MKLRKILSLLLALVLVFGIASGCKNTEQNDKPSSTPTTSPKTSDPGESIEPDGSDAVTFPLTEKVEFSLWTLMFTINQTLRETESENPAVQELEKRTNVHIKFVHPPAGSETETYSLMMASQEFEDVMIQASSQYTLAQLLELGAATDLTDIIPEKMPNYYSFLQGDENISRDCRNDDGQILAVNMLYEREGDHPGLNWAGLVVRQDLLDQLDLGLPETYGDWETMLTGFKGLGIKYPLMIPGGGSYTQWSTFESGFGVGARFYRDGTEVKYGPLEDGYYEYVLQMKDWFDKGLIPADFAGMALNEYGVVTGEGYNSGDIGAGLITSSELGTTLADLGMVTNPDFYSTAVYTPVKNNGDTNRFDISAGSGKVGAAFTISADIEPDRFDVILALLDYMYSEEGHLLASYGVEGYSWNYDENGNPKYTDLVDNSAQDGINVFHIYSVAFYAFPMLEDEKERSAGRAPEIIEMQERWTTRNYDFGVMPAVTMTEAESAIYATKANDVNTYAAEMTAKFISGIEPIENYPNFVRTIENIGIREALAAYQAAYDRYLAR